MRQILRTTLVLGTLLALLTPHLARAGGHAGEDPPARPHERPVGMGGGAPGPAGDGEAPASPPPTRVVSILGQGQRPAIARDHIVVEFAPDLAGWQRRQIAAAAGATTFKMASTGRFAKVGVAAGDDPHALADRLGRLSGVLFAEVDPLAYPQATSVEPNTGPGTDPDGKEPIVDKRSYADPLFSFQWTHARIHLSEAIDLDSRLGENVIVAVLDSGVAYGDGADFPARRGLDLGATRFLPGIDVVDGGPGYDRGVEICTDFDPSFCLNLPRFGHGTFIATQIAGGVDNGLAGASIAPRVTILPVRVIGDDNSALYSDVVEGIDLAVAAGARVLNLSLGGGDPSALLEQAIARAHAAGAVIVAAAGNDAEEPTYPGDILYPARYPAVIAVGATGFDDRRAGYSNYGPGVDIVAPAGDSTASFPLPGIRDAALSSSFVYDPATGHATYASYWANGTSFAAPQVAAAAALFMSLGVRDPDAVRELLLATAHDLQDAGDDEDTGRGLLDLLEAHRGLGFGF